MTHPLDPGRQTKPYKNKIFFSHRKKHKKLPTVFAGNK